VGSDSITEFGVQVTPEMITLQAGRLPPPILELGSKKGDGRKQKVPDEKTGSWSLSGRDDKFYLPAKVPPFICLDVAGIRDPRKIRYDYSDLTIMDIKYKVFASSNFRILGTLWRK